MGLTYLPTSSTYLPTALTHTQTHTQLLEREPTHYEALSKLLYLLRRFGKLSDASKYIVQAEHASTRASSEPGLNYCKGLHMLFTTQPNEALKFMNLARKDSEWCVSFFMIMPLLPRSLFSSFLLHIHTLTLTLTLTHV